MLLSALLRFAVPRLIAAPGSRPLRSLGVFLIFLEPPALARERDAVHPADRLCSDLRIIANALQLQMTL